MYKSICICLFLLLLNVKLIKSQTVFANVHRSFLVPHTTSIYALNNKKINMLELGISYYGDSSKHWKKWYKNAHWGISLLYTKMGNPSQIGNVIGLSPFFNFPIFTKNKSSIGFELGTGLAYVSKPFDLINNYKNVAIGSKLNIFLRGYFTYCYKINSHIRISLGAGITHISNGALKVPNLGLNVLSTKIQLSYYLQKAQTNLASKTKDELLFNNSQKIHQVNLGFGKKQIQIDNKINYLITSFQYQYGWYYKRYFISQFIIDYNNNPSIKKEINAKSKLVNNRLALGFTQDFLIHRLSVVLTNAAYIINANPKQKFYTKLGIKYYFKRNFTCSLSLKTHLNKADFIETSIGYVFY